MNTLREHSAALLAERHAPPATPDEVRRAREYARAKLAECADTMRKIEGRG